MYNNLILQLHGEISVVHIVQYWLKLWTVQELQVEDAAQNYWQRLGGRTAWNAAGSGGQGPEVSE